MKKNDITTKVKVTVSFTPLSRSNKGYEIEIVWSNRKISYACETSTFSTGLPTDVRQRARLREPI